MTQNTNTETFEKFAQGLAGVENRTGTLETRRLRDGNVELVSYGWQRLAVYDDETGEITAFEGWAEWAEEQDGDAETTPRHVRRVKEYADNVVSRSPQVAAPPRSVAEIGHVGRHD